MIILYHANCNDGSTSALAAWLKFGDEGHRYIAVTHGKPPPPEVAGQDVLIVDFSYPRDILLAMKARSILILDHHISAQKDLTQPFPANSHITAHFDMNRSGAMITWQYFFPDAPIPLLIKLIQDRDIWINAYPQSPFLTYGLTVFSTDFRDWKTLIDQPAILDKTIEAGESIFDYMHKQIARIKVNRKIHSIAGFKVPVVNAPSFMVSDLLHEILNDEPTAPFAAAYNDIIDQGLRNYSLRSENHREDVSVIAKKYGGGGHRNAAAFTVPLKLEDI